MLDAILKDPSAITIIAMLVAAIAAFVRGDVMPGRRLYPINPTFA